MADPVPGKLYAANYPDFFPCATWAFAEDITEFARRTPYDSGWTRQRKQYPEAGQIIDLSFVMPTTTFDNWMRWVEANGHEFFTMHLDQYGADPLLAEVRFITDVSWSYTSYDRIEATVRADHGGYPGVGAGLIQPPSELACVPVSITFQPQNVTVDELGDPAYFSVGVSPDSTLPTTYQWYYDGAPIDGATGYSIVGISSAENIEHPYHVVVTNPCGEVVSAIAKIYYATDYVECVPYDCSAFVTTANALGAKVTSFQDWMYGNLPAVIPDTDLTVAGDYVNEVGNAMPAGPFQSYWNIAASDIDQCPGVTQGLFLNEAGFPNGFDQLSFTSPSNSLIMAHKGPLIAGWDTLDMVINRIEKYEVYVYGAAQGYYANAGNGIEWSPTSPDSTYVNRFVETDSYSGIPITPIITWDSGMNLTVATATAGALYTEDVKFYPDDSYPGQWRKWYSDDTLAVTVNDSSWAITVKREVYSVVIQNGAGGWEGAGLNTTLVGTGDDSSQVLKKAGAYLFALGTSDVMSPEQLEDLYIGLQRNYADYVPPAWCPGPKP